MGREGTEPGATCGKKSLEQAGRTAAQRASEREKGANTLGERAPRTHPKRSGFGFGEAGSATTRPYSLGEPHNPQFFFVCSVFFVCLFVFCRVLQRERRTRFAGWVAIGDRLALLLVLRPCQCYRAGSEGSRHPFVRRGTAHRPNPAFAKETRSWSPEVSQCEGTLHR